MLFISLRIFAWVALAIPCIFAIRRSRVVRKRALMITSIVLLILLVSLTAMFPVENLFLRFDTPEDVFHYTSTGDIYGRVDGESSSMILYATSPNTISEYIVPKTDTGYVIPTYLSNKTVWNSMDSNGVVQVYWQKGTQDHYVMVFLGADAADWQIQLFDATGNPVDAHIVRAPHSGFAYFSLPVGEFRLVAEERELAITVPDT